MTEMVDKVAAAIAEVLTRDRPHPASGRPYCLLIVEDEDAKEMARSAIEAVKVELLKAKWCPIYGYDGLWPPGEQQLAAVDEALSRPP